MKNLTSVVKKFDETYGQSDNESGLRHRAIDLLVVRHITAVSNVMNTDVISLFLEKNRF